MAKHLNPLEKELLIHRFKENQRIKLSDFCTANGISDAAFRRWLKDYSETHFALGAPSLIDVIKLRMFELGLTQKSLSELIGVSPSRVSDYFSGKCEPTLKVARSISRNLNIDANIVLGV